MSPDSPVADGTSQFATINTFAVSAGLTPFSAIAMRAAGVMINSESPWRHESMIWRAARRAAIAIPGSESDTWNHANSRRCCPMNQALHGELVRIHTGTTALTAIHERTITTVRRDHEASTSHL